MREKLQAIGLLLLVGGGVFITLLIFIGGVLLFNWAAGKL